MSRYPQSEDEAYNEPNKQQLALADVLVLQSQKLNVLPQDALPHVIQQTICPSRYVITLPV